LAAGFEEPFAYRLVGLLELVVGCPFQPRSPIRSSCQRMLLIWSWPRCSISSRSKCASWC
jgi:hypothetical protein